MKLLTGTVACCGLLVILAKAPIALGATASTAPGGTGFYNAKEAATDTMTVLPQDGKTPVITRSVIAPDMPGDMGKVKETSKEGAVIKFDGRTTNWGCTYFVFGTFVAAATLPAAGPGSEWQATFKQQSGARLWLEINSDSSLDNQVPLGTATGALKATVLTPEVGKTYKVTYAVTGGSGQINAIADSTGLTSDHPVDHKDIVSTRTGNLILTGTLVDVTDPAHPLEVASDCNAFRIVDYLVTELSFDCYLYSDTGAEYKAPQWKPSEGRNVPLLYIFNRQLKVSGTISWPGVQGSVDIHCSGIDSKNNLYQFGTKRIDNFNQVINFDSWECQTPFDEKIDVRDLLLSWYMTVGEDFFDLNNSTNTVFLITGGGNVTPTQLRYTVLNTSCSSGSGMGVLDTDAKKRQFVAAVNSKFKSCCIQKETAQILTYYGHTMPRLPTDTSTLLNDGDGRCGSWGDFFYDCLKLQSMSMLDVVKVRIVPGVGYNRMTVKSTSGQGGTPSVWSFGDHCLVKCDGKYYDPSYGTGPYDTLLDWQKASLGSVRRTDGTEDTDMTALHVTEE